MGELPRHTAFIRFEFLGVAREVEEDAHDVQEDEQVEYADIQRNVPETPAPIALP